MQQKTSLGKNKQKWALIPPWEMPSDPVKAVFWFLRWLLAITVNFFWIPIIVMVIYEAIINSKVGGVGYGLISGGITLLVGLLVWGLLFVVLLAIRVTTAVAHTVSEFGQSYYRVMNMPYRETEYQPRNEALNVVEGTITDLEEERKKRRRSE